jgi:UDP-glucose 4-epimerase
VRRLADTRAAEHDLRFRARIPLEDGLRDLVDWWRPLRDQVSAGRTTAERR